jgi:hypothetical protein
MILNMLVAGLVVVVDLPRDQVFDYLIRTLEKIKAEVKNADRTLYRIEGKSAAA